MTVFSSGGLFFMSPLPLEGMDEPAEPFLQGGAPTPAHLGGWSCQQPVSGAVFWVKAPVWTHRIYIFSRSHIIAIFTSLFSVPDYNGAVLLVIPPPKLNRSPETAYLVLCLQPSTEKLLLKLMLCYNGTTTRRSGGWNQHLPGSVATKPWGEVLVMS